MTVLARLDAWRTTGAIGDAQHDTLAALTRRDPFSIFIELNALLYLGVLSFAAGVAWSVATYSARLGDAAILSTLTAAFAAALYYCFTHGLPYSHGEVEHPGAAFDYVLYLGCLIFASDLGYVESRFHPFGADWDHTLLVAAAMFFALAYRFDNRFVLSLALSSLGAWFGVRVARFGLLFDGSLRGSALAYGTLVVACGTALHRAGIKKHFFETYLHVAAHVLFIALVSGAAEWDGGLESAIYLAALIGLAALAIVQGTRFKRFVFVVYGVVYAYAGVTGRVLPSLHGEGEFFAYFAVTGTLVVVALVVLSRRFGRDA
jgi:hypothetical protein